MTARDRMVVIVIATLAVLAAAWLLAVSPKREQATKLDAQVSAAQAQLASAESEVASARGAQAKYAQAYASIVSLGKAVPASQEVPSLIYQLAQASNQKNVEFASITAGGGTGAGASSGGAGGAASSTASAATSASATAGGGFKQLPFTFVFNGSFSDLYNLFQQLNRYTLRTTSGGLQVSGRLLTIQSVRLAPASGSGSETAKSAGATKSAGKGKSSEQLSGTITATAYILPAGQSLTGGATSAGPAGAGTQTASAGATGSATAPAVIGAHP
jgi:hypothetical protein